MIASLAFLTIAHQNGHRISTLGRATCISFLSSKRVQVGGEKGTVAIDLSTGHVESFSQTKEPVERFVEIQGALWCVSGDEVFTGKSSIRLPIRWPSETITFLGNYQGTPLVASTWQAFLISGNRLQKIETSAKWRVFDIGPHGEVVLTGSGVAVGTIGKHGSALNVRGLIPVRGASSINASCYLGHGRWLFGSTSGTLVVAEQRTGRHWSIFSRQGLIPISLSSSRNGIVCAAFANKSKEGVPDSEALLALWKVGDHSKQILTLLRGRKFTSASISPDGIRVIAIDIEGRLYGWKLGAETTMRANPIDFHE